jgi:hypothetical protein
VKGKITFAWCSTVAGTLLLLHGSLADILLAILLFICAFIMGSIIAASGRLGAGIMIIAGTLLFAGIVFAARILSFSCG